MKPSIIENKIHEIKGHKIILDYDLAALYEVETRVFNQAVKRNIDRFPKDFMFRLTKKEWDDIRSQNVTASAKRNISALPYAFTEHGVTMAASILKSKKAVKMNISIVRAFISLRQVALKYKELVQQIDEIKQTVGNHGDQLSQIYNTLENLLDEKVTEKKWEEREPIGFKVRK